MAKAEDVVIKIKTDSGQLDSGLKETERKLGSFGSSVSSKLGGAIAAGFATKAILDFATQSVEAAAAAQRAQGKVEQAVKQTGEAAGLTATALKDLAKGLMEVTTFDDDQILNDVTAQLLTFTNVTGDNFKRAQKAIMDVSTLLDGDLKSAAIQVGKALNDPVTSLTALTRSGIQFTAEQKKQINQLTASNQLFEAQSIILAEIERQYGGQAEALAKLPMGQIQQMRNAWGEVKESLGMVILTSDSLLDSLNKSKKMFYVWASDEATFWEKLAISVELFDKRAEKLYNQVKAREDLKKMNDENRDSYIAYMRSMAEGNKVEEKHEKTIAEMITDTEQLRIQLHSYTGSQYAEREATMLQIQANEALIKSLTTLKIVRENSRMLSMDKMQTKTDMPQIGDNLAGQVTLMPEFDKIKQSADGYMQKYRDLLAEQQTEVDALNERFSGALADSLAGGIEAAFSGQGLESTLIAFLNPLANFLTTEGSMLIAHGIAVEAFKKSLTSFNGIPAIVAGAAMVATGAAFKGFVKGGMKQSGAGYSTTGGGYGGGGGGLNAGTGKQSIDITGKFVAEGNDLVYVLSKTYHTNSRTRT